MTSSRAAVPRSLYRTFRMPLLTGLISAVGLIGALLGDGVWDALSWLALAFPLWVTYRSLATSVRSES